MLKMRSPTPAGDSHARPPVAYSSVMPIGAQDHLEGLYGRQRLLSAEASRLESERDLLGKNSDRRYILDLEIVALREEASRISARIADVLERDLQR
jgi:hypothetical protein